MNRIYNLIDREFREMKCGYFPLF